MCPSFRVTREEQHSTRGRAHLLWEMAKGDVISGGWQDTHVKESLDLCLSCKGCKSDCPVAVDVATYKAEFLSHFYERRVRPLNHYAFARIDVWSRMASVAPGLANFLTHAPAFGGLAKFAAGISPHRQLPRFAKQSFRRWFTERKKRQSVTAPRVLLWPDTFNNYFRPETAIAATEVLESAGFVVCLPKQDVCCGRPLYDFGMLHQARKYLARTVVALTEEIAEAIPVVVLEPSCASVFRDEMLNLLPDDTRARKLAKQVLLLSEFLEVNADVFSLPALHRKALVHGHCHHRSILKMKDEEAVLRRLGIDYQIPAPGCCGMAGAFGFEEEKYETSIAIGELELLPAVRKLPEDYLIIANGFSCREQISQCTGRSTVHLAEVVQLGLREQKPLRADSIRETSGASQVGR